MRVPCSAMQCHACAMRVQESKSAKRTSVKPVASASAHEGELLRRPILTVMSRPAAAMESWQWWWLQVSSCCTSTERPLAEPASRRSHSAKPSLPTLLRPPPLGAHLQVLRLRGRLGAPAEDTDGLHAL